MSNKYFGALQRQTVTAEKRAESAIPEKNAVPLVISNPYCGPMLTALYLPAWPREVKLCCDPFTSDRLTDTTMYQLSKNFQAIGISLCLPNGYARHQLDFDRKKNSYHPGYNERAVSITPDDDDLYAAHGIGVIWMRMPGDTQSPLYIGDHQLTQKQIETLMEEYDIYHDYLRAIISKHMDMFGASYHISLQSFSREEAVLLGADENKIPQFVLGYDETTADEGFSSKLAHTIAGKGYIVTQNEIFPIGQLTRNHASPVTGAQSIQLKIFDGLYLDPETLGKSRNYRKIAMDLHGIMMTMAHYTKDHACKQQPTADRIDLATQRAARTTHAVIKPETP